MTNPTINTVNVFLLQIARLISHFINYSSTPLINIPCLSFNEWQVVKLLPTLKYISLLSATDTWDFLGVHCYIKTKEQKEIVKTLVSDQELTIRGKITDVGEVLGYYLDITEIIVN